MLRVGLRTARGLKRVLRNPHPAIARFYFPEPMQDTRFEGTRMEIADPEFARIRVW